MIRGKMQVLDQVVFPEAVRANEATRLLSAATRDAEVCALTFQLAAAQKLTNGDTDVERAGADCVAEQNR